MERTITAEQTARFAQALQAADRAPGTIENYLRHVRAFARWLRGSPLLPESAAQWRDALLEQGYTPGTVNSMIGPLNRFFQFLGWNECKAKQLRIQRQLFRENQKELNTTVPVLMEGPSKHDPSILQGKSPKNQTVHAPVPEGANAEDFVGKMVDVAVDTARTWYLSGTLAGSPR